MSEERSPYTVVPNKADIFPTVDADNNSYDTEKVCRAFWNKYGTEQGLDWYKEGVAHGTYSAEGSTGGELLEQLTFIINKIAVKHLRDHNKPVDKNLKDMLKMLTMSTSLVLSNSVDTVNANEGMLDREDILAFLHGFINSQYEKVRIQYVD